jgi:hypothetical protein
MSDALRVWSDMTQEQFSPVNCAACLAPHVPSHWRPSLADMHDRDCPLMALMSTLDLVLGHVMCGEAWDVAARDAELARERKAAQEAKRAKAAQKTPLDQARVWYSERALEIGWDPTPYAQLATPFGRFTRAELEGAA